MLIRKTEEQALFEQGVEMAKQEMSGNIWYNLNIDRLRNLISFCMDFINVETGGNIEEDTERPYYN